MNSDDKPYTREYAQDALAVPVEEFAKRLSVSQSLIWKLIRQNEIAAVRLGRRTLVPASEIERIMETAGE